jgi:hypothetical protein
MEHTAGPSASVGMTSLAVVARVENSPGRQSWVEQESSMSPVGDDRELPGRKSWAAAVMNLHNLEAYPTLASNTRVQDSRPGPLSAVPSGLMATAEFSRRLYGPMILAPCEPATMATVANPRKSPCSTTPVMLLRVCASAAGSSICP